MWWTSSRVNGIYNIIEAQKLAMLLVLLSDTIHTFLFVHPPPHIYYSGDLNIVYVFIIFFTSLFTCHLFHLFVYRENNYVKITLKTFVKRIIQSRQFEGFN